MFVLYRPLKTGILRILTRRFQRIFRLTPQHRMEPWILFQKWIELAKCASGHIIRSSHRHEEILFYGRHDGGFDVRLFTDVQFF